MVLICGKIYALRCSGIGQNNFGHTALLRSESSFVTSSPRTASSSLDHQEAQSPSGSLGSWIQKETNSTINGQTKRSPTSLHTAEVSLKPSSKSSSRPTSAGVSAYKSINSTGNKNQLISGSHGFKSTFATKISSGINKLGRLC